VLFGLGIDPGETHFGLALVRFSVDRVNARVQRGDAQCLHTRSKQPKLVDTDFEVRWAALWDLKQAGGGTGKLEDETKAIIRLIHRTPILQRLLGDQRLVLFPEIQEGGDWRSNPGRAQTLMRTGSLMAAFVGIFMHYGHHVHYAGKKSRWGWTSYTHTDGWKELTPEARRKRGKACITLYVKDLVSRQQQEAPDGILYRPIGNDESWSAPNFYWRLASHQVYALICGRGVSFEDSAHYADCVVIAMFGMRNLLQPNRRHTNIIESSSWPTLVEQAEARVPNWSGNRKKTRIVTEGRATANGSGNSGVVPIPMIASTGCDGKMSNNGSTSSHLHSSLYKAVTRMDTTSIVASNTAKNSTKAPMITTMKGKKRPNPYAFKSSQNRRGSHRFRTSEKRARRW